MFARGHRYCRRSNESFPISGDSVESLRARNLQSNTAISRLRSRLAMASSVTAAPRLQLYDTRLRESRNRCQSRDQRRETRWRKPVFRARNRLCYWHIIVGLDDSRTIGLHIFSLSLSRSSNARLFRSIDRQTRLLLLSSQRDTRCYLERRRRSPQRRKRDNRRERTRLSGRY